MTAASAKPVQAPSAALVEDLGHGRAVDQLVRQRDGAGLIDEVARVDPVRHGVEVAPDALGRGEDALRLAALGGLGSGRLREGVLVARRAGHGCRLGAPVHVVPLISVVRWRMPSDRDGCHEECAPSGTDTCLLR